MCPPRDAVPFNGLFYRVCKNETPTEEDFLTHFDLNNIPKGKACEARALSFYDNFEDANRLTKMVKKFRKSVPVLVKIEPKHGIGKINKHHLELWEFKGISFVHPEIEQEGGE